MLKRVFNDYVIFLILTTVYFICSTVVVFLMTENQLERRTGGLYFSLTLSAITYYYVKREIISMPFVYTFINIIFTMVEFASISSILQQREMMRLLANYLSNIVYGGFTYILFLFFAPFFLAVNNLILHNLEYKLKKLL